MSLVQRIYRTLPLVVRMRMAKLLEIKFVRKIAFYAVGGGHGDDEIINALITKKPIDLVVHVGAHLAEESSLYESLGAETVLWIEADPDLFKRMNERLFARPLGKTRHITYQALVSESDDLELRLHRYSNDGASNSVYTANDEFSRAWPGLKETGEVLRIGTKTLPSILMDTDIVPSSYRRGLLVLDVQGHELAVLKGTPKKFMSSFELVCVEISTVNVYNGGAEGKDVTAWLSSCGFDPTTTVPRFHGDLLMERNPKEPRQ